MTSAEIIRMNNIFKQYSLGMITVNKANEELKAIGSDLYLDLGRNVLTAADVKNTKLGKSIAEINGYGFMVTGTGSADKVKIINGKLLDDVNEVQPDGSVNMIAEVFVLGHHYFVKGRTLTLK